MLPIAFITPTKDQGPRAKDQGSNYTTQKNISANHQSCRSRSNYWILSEDIRREKWDIYATGWHISQKDYIDTEVSAKKAGRHLQDPLCILWTNYSCWSWRILNERWMPDLPMMSKLAAVASVGSQSVTCIKPEYSEPQSSSGMWLGEYTNAGTYKEFNISDTVEEEGLSSKSIMKGLKGKWSSSLKREGINAVLYVLYVSFGTP